MTFAEKTIMTTMKNWLYEDHLSAFVEKEIDFFLLISVQNSFGTFPTLCWTLLYATSHSINSLIQKNNISMGEQFEPRHTITRDQLIR